MWNWNSAALTKNTSQHSDSVLRLHVSPKIKVHIAHYRLQVKEVWEISCAVPSTFFEAIVPLHRASNCSSGIVTFELANTAQNFSLCPFGITGKKQDLHLCSTRHLHSSPSQDRCGSGNIWPWAFLTCSRRREEGLVLPQRCLTVLQGFARHSYKQNISRDRATPLQSPSSYTALFLFSPVGQILTLFIVGKCPICKMWVG